MVRKKDGSLRFGIDYRKLNGITKKDIYPLPRCGYWQIGVKGYWQIGVKEMDDEKTAFSTPEGHFQFKRMPFGLTNAPATFKRAMNPILNGLNWTD